MAPVVRLVHSQKTPTGPPSTLEEVLQGALMFEFWVGITVGLFVGATLGAVVMGWVAVNAAHREWEDKDGH